MKTQTATADVKTYVGNDAITELVNSARSIWQGGQDDRLTLGEKFSKLRAEVDKYRRNNKGLTYRQAVNQTGVPWSTAERYRAMFEVVAEHKIPADVFLALCEAHANIAEIKAVLKEAFTPSIKRLLPRIASLDVTDIEGVNKLADELNQLLPRSLAASDLETLNQDLNLLWELLQKTENKEACRQILRDAAEKQEELAECQMRMMKSLVHGLAPFVQWSPKQVRDYLAEFAEQPPALQTKLFGEATKFAQGLAIGLSKSATDET
jgi:hypothetical protein